MTKGTRNRDDQGKLNALKYDERLNRDDVLFSEMTEVLNISPRHARDLVIKLNIPKELVVRGHSPVALLKILTWRELQK